MSKQDRQGVRTPAQVEQKYNLGAIHANVPRTSLEVSQLMQSLAQYMAATNATIDALTQEIAKGQGMANALKAEASGETVILTDISPIEHILTIELTSSTPKDFSTVTLTRYGENEEDNAETYTPTEDGIVEGVKSLSPITTLTTDGVGVIIEVTYNKDLNKAFAEIRG